MSCNYLNICVLSHRVRDNMLYVNGRGGGGLRTGMHGSDRTWRVLEMEPGCGETRLSPGLVLSLGCSWCWSRGVVLVTGLCHQPGGH